MKKFGRGLLARVALAPRLLHIFEQFAREYEKGLSEEEKVSFRRVFGK